jgi:ubiquinone/menaquinone biosynthesis C-methylase UbiE
MTPPHPAWEDLSRREPFFSVLPIDAHRMANLTPERRTAFFASGETHVQWMLRTIAPLAPDFAPISALEYGCGIGRLALPLAWRVQSVTAVDRSPTMLAHAREHTTRLGVTNIIFATPEELHASPRKFDLVVCHLVLQRLPIRDGLRLIDELMARIAPGGFGLFQFPYATTASRGVQAMRWLRERVPVVNAIANRLRGKAAAEPFIPTHAYHLYAVLDRVGRVHVEATQVLPTTQDDPPTATVLTRAPLISAPRRRSRPADVDANMAVTSGADARTVPVIDVRDVIAKTPLEALNRTAEEYFSTLTDWDHHLAKPFANAKETPQLLIDVANLLQGLRLSPGVSVLEFGAGSGWLSRWLTQLGCRVTLLDVSPTALTMAREHYARLPVIGEKPPPTFLPFDGRHIDLPDGSVDRLVSFHAFHHATNPDEVIREFARVLAPGGVAAFAEPGPRHSRTPLSQFEMRTYGVVENDVDIHAIWDTARAAGFTDLKLAVYHEPPFHVSIDAFEDLLTGGETNEAWASATRVFLRNSRTFFLTKAGASRQDSRSTDGLACVLDASLVTEQLMAGEPIVIDATVTNSGTAIWLPWPGQGGVGLGSHLYDAAGALLNFDLYCASLTEPPREIEAAETVRLRMALPPLEAGRYRLELDCMAGGVTWFAQVGSRPVAFTLDVGPEAPARTSSLIE